LFHAANGSGAKNAAKKSDDNKPGVRRPAIPLREMIDPTNQSINNQLSLSFFTFMFSPGSFTPGK